MSNSPPGYMDGVPVKISEKYKPPCRITTPQNLFARVATSSEAIALANYDFGLEKNVINKIAEWKASREQEVADRRERIRQLEEAKRKRSEEIEAAETEERRKQLTEVSYPSTDDLSELSWTDSYTPPECQLTDCPTPPQHAQITTQYLPNVLNKQNNTDYQITPTYYTNTATTANILTPMLIRTVNTTTINNPANFVSSYNNQDIRNIADGKSTVFNKINYSDFESDTSSPFDNMELKTINDLELLAQVLSNTQMTHSEDTNINSSTKNTEQESALYYSTNRAIDYNAPQSEFNAVYNSNIYYTAANPIQPPASNVYTGVNSTGEKSSPSALNGYGYVPRYNYTYTSSPPQYQYSKPNTTDYKLTNMTYANPNLQNHYVALNDKVYNYQKFQYDNSQTPLPQAASLTSQKSKSRSVPDIVRELQCELTQMKERENKRSQNSSPATVVQNCPEFTRSNKQSRNKGVSDRKGLDQEVLLDPYKTLSTRMQRMSTHISQMGFPLARVARACQLIGDNDKKVIEHLLVMDQLLDLGFPESRISQALIQFNNNRDQALEFLIS